MGGAALKQGLPALPPETLAACRKADAVLLGAVGDPAFDHLPSKERPEGGLLAIRKGLGVYANLRPGEDLAGRGRGRVRSSPSSRPAPTCSSCAS